MKTKLASLIQNLITPTCRLNVLWKTYTKTRGVVAQKIVNFVDIGIRTSNLTCPMEYYNNSTVALTVIDTGTVKDDIIL
jgi:hypothetical protein